MEDQPRHQPMAAATQYLRDLFSTRGPSTAQVLKVVTLVLLSGVLLLLAGLTLAGTLIGLAVTAPLFVLFTPVLIPAALTIGLAVTGFLTSVAFGVMALFFFTWMVNYLRRTRERPPVSDGQHEDAGAPTSSTSPQRSDSGSSAPINNEKEKSDILVNQQQQKNRRTIPRSQDEDTGEQSDSEPSASHYTSAVGNNYYVFLSFRGADTRKAFVDHLYHRLKDEGLPFHPDFVYRDNDDLRMGDRVAAGLFSAIDHSRISIPVISEHYGNSKWCLRELIRIMKCHKSGRQIVLPVLYKVKTNDVQYVTGPFGKAFHSKKRYSDKFKTEAKEALKQALELRVYKSDEDYSGEEARLVKELVEEIRCHLQRDFPTYRPVDLVGFDDHVAKVMNLADTAFSETRIIVIHGTGGVGKTTLVTTIYERLFQQFQWHSFLKDIRQTIESKDMQYVQSLLTSDLTKGSERAVRHSDIGIGYIQQASKGKKVLMVLDDVDCRDHLDKLIDRCEFESGSRIFITCRNKTLLKSGYKEHELQKLNPTDSLLLFNRYAFGVKQPSEELAVLSSKIVDTTGGLPLALVIVGSLLKDKDPSIWMETLEKLKKVPNENVQKMLRLSYDSLGYREQQMFLDIACFFVGVDKRIATHIWDDLQFSSTIGLKTLVDCSLIIDNGNNELRMHDQLRDLGRAIARPADKKLWKCSRLWDEEAITVQRGKKENRNIEALRLDKKGSSKFMEQKSFKRMPHLKFLHLSEVDLVGYFGDSLSELRWLEWKLCSDSTKVTYVHLEKLLVLDLSGGYISHEWRGWSSIKTERLKVLNLSRCSDLESTPDLSAFENLEMLILESCENLEVIDPSIGKLERLISLNLRYCGILMVLPEQLGKLKELEELILDETDVQEIPPWIGSLGKLKTLSAVGCRLLTRVDDSISSLLSLSTLNLKACVSLEGFVVSFRAHGKLQRLSLERCNKLRVIPSSIGNLGELVELDLSHTIIDELPESMAELKKLEILRISHSKIKKLPTAIGELESLKELHASGCRKLEGQIPRKRNGLSFLKTLRLGGAKISGLPENFHELSSLENLDLLGCVQLQSLPKPPSLLSSLQLTCRSGELQSLSHLMHLKELTLHSCMSLQSIPELPSCIRKLRLRSCPNLEKLSILPEWKSLSELELLQCNGLTELDGLETLTSLRKLNLSTSTDLSNLSNFDDLESVSSSDSRRFDFKKADNLHVIVGLENLRSLEVLNISGRKHIEGLNLSNSEHLRQLIVKDCPSLVEILIPDRVSLERFDWAGRQPQITIVSSARPAT
ncbi:disease resistance protein RPV1-like [Rhodamnia argentea]|uniref:Disease resistance protein RPV1-like n=1 Tax=Rhodamnia argentea TaxID=178133 RepID=A0ABM3H9U7_9MYRT|nr:disease resistance protein RPV1-like [Rhodamnia argentea]